MAGGYGNSASGDFSATPGGRGLTLDAAAARSFGFHANTAAGDRNMTISASDVAVFGNTDLWLANNDNAPSELRFFEAYNTAGAFPNTANYTAFKAQAQTGDITYTLPPSAPTTTGQILSATTGGVMSWVDGPTLAQSFSNNSSTTPTLNLTNSNATGTALQISDGKMVVSTASYASAGTIGGDVVAAHVNDNGVGSSAATITLPTGVAGQILYVSTADPDGVAISDGVTTIYTLADDDVVVTLLFIGGKWKPIP
ncbi:MAG: hypothetical protein IT211_00895 [Armatimonadetes bacterium]|nr:hypothetical protein [Armatimonadota bacterium]